MTEKTKLSTVMIVTFFYLFLWLSCRTLVSEGYFKSSVRYLTAYTCTYHEYKAKTPVVVIGIRG